MRTRACFGGLLFLAFAHCTMKTPRLVTLSVGMNGSQLQSAPELAAMCCYFVSVTGSEITPNKNLLGACVRTGVLSETVAWPIPESAISIRNVPIGTGTVALYGVKTTGSCPKNASEILDSADEPE